MKSSLLLSLITFLLINNLLLIKNVFGNVPINQNDNDDDDSPVPSRQIVFNLFHGKSVFQSRLIPWNLPSEILTSSKRIDCGASKGDLDNTIGISICDDHIFQFNSDFTVTIYPKSRKKYSTETNTLHLIEGSKVDLERIEPEIIHLGGYRKRSEFILHYFPSINSTNRLWMSLTRSPIGFEWRSSIMVSDYQSWMCSQNYNDIDSGPKYRFEYEMTSKLTRTIPISAVARFYSIAYHTESNEFLLFINEMYMDVPYFGKLCLGYKKANTLRLISHGNCDRYDGSDSKTNSHKNIKELLKSIQFGFTSFSDLILASTHDDQAIIINRRILSIFDNDFSFIKKKLTEYLSCDTQIHSNAPHAPSNDDDSKRKKRSIKQRKRGRK